MGPRSLSALHRLQEVETHLRSLKDMLRRKERHLEQQKLRNKQLVERSLSKKEEIKARQTQTNHLELDFKTRDASVAKLQAQLNSAKSNKEYSAILIRLNTERAENSKLEERILRDLTSIDEMKKALGDMETDVKGQQDQLSHREQEFESERQDLQNQIDALEQKRSAVAAEVPPSDLSTFERVADRQDGQAMAMIVKPVRGSEEYICTGCNMTIPMETVNALLTRDEIQQCHICGRILFLEDKPDGET